MNKVLFRIIWNIFLFISIVTLPWWITLGIVGFGVVFFPIYIEALIAGFIVDSLYQREVYELWATFFGFGMLSMFVLFRKMVR